MAKILITRPNHDETTNYLHYWTKLVIDKALEKGLTVFDLASKKATNKNFYSYLQHNPCFIFFNGHGSSAAITGYNNEILLELPCGQPLFKVSIIFARACQAGRKLGKDLVRNGVKAFLGYSDNFIFLRLKNFSTRPLDDFLAKLFLEPSNLIAGALIKGNTAQEAYIRSVTALRKNLSLALSSTASSEIQTAAPYLWSDINCQVLWGNPEAKLSED